MKILVLGASGFAGRPLVRELLARGHEVVGAGRSPEPPPAMAARGAGPAWLPCDVTDPEAVRATLGAALPEAVVVLSGLASPPAANRAAPEAFRVNALGVVHLLDAIERGGGRIRAAIVTSSEVYGAGGSAGSPIHESEPLRPATLYGASKAAADHAAMAFAARGLDVVVLRPFNHAGAGQKRDFVCADFAHQLVEIARGRRESVMEVGDLDVQRDFTDVRDIVRGYALGVERGRAGEAYNLCSGRPTSIREILSMLCDLAGVAPEIRSPAVRRRAGEPGVVFGSPAKAAEHLGWQPEIPLREMLAWVLDDAVARLEVAPPDAAGG